MLATHNIVPAYEILILIAQASDKGSDKLGRMGSLGRAFAAHFIKAWKP